MNGDGIGTWDGKAPYSAGARAPWRGDWGPISDYHSRLGRLARRIELQLLVEYDGTRPLWASRIREAAELKAHAQRARSLLGVDPKVTLRSITVATMVAERLLARVAKNGGAKSPTLPELAPRKADLRA